MAAAKRLIAILVISLTGAAARAQMLSVWPVNIFLPPGQRAATLSVTNSGNSVTGIQVRAYAWNQKDGDDQITATRMVIASPPLASIPPGATQVVRLVLRQLPQDRESTYRVLVDQIPPPAEPGVVHMVLRLSIPIFAEPRIRVAAQVKFHMESHIGKVVLVGINSGLSHETIRDIVITTGDGHKLKTVSSSSPYILAGTTQYWLLETQGYLPQTSEALQLTAHALSGVIHQQVSVVMMP
jgi:fimbrial chaperone protein